MSTPRQFGAKSNRAAAPIEFTIHDDDGNDLGTFHVTPKPRLDIAEAAARAVTLDKGARIYDINILSYCLQEFMVRELWVAMPTDEDPAAGAWVEADDRQRLLKILTSDRSFIPIETLGEIVTWLLTETSGNPTGAPKPS